MDQTTNSQERTQPALDSKTKKIRDADLIISALFIAGSLWTAYESFRMSREVYTKGLANLYTVPGLFPFIVSVAILGCSIYVFLNALRVGGDLKFLLPSNIMKSFNSLEAFTPTIVFVALVVYVYILAERISFDIATFIFVAFLMAVFKAAKLIWIIVISALYAAVIVFFFSEVVGTSFPVSIFF